MTRSRSMKNRRRFLRAAFYAPLIAHDNKRVLNGSCVNISVLGLSFFTPDEYHPVGSKILVHVKPGSGISAFNAVCEVVSAVRVVDSKDPNKKAMKYGMRFVKIAPKIQEEIHVFTQKNKGQVAA